MENATLHISMGTFKCHLVKKALRVLVGPVNVAKSGCQCRKNGCQPSSPLLSLSLFLFYFIALLYNPSHPYRPY